MTLNEQEFARCVEFAKKCALNQQEIEFGQSDTKPRDTAEISRDNLIGKMAEVAFAKMLYERCSIEIELDFNYYPRGNGTIRTRKLMAGELMSKRPVKVADGC